MNRILATAALVFALPVPPGAQAAGAEWTLITPEEDARDTAAPHVRQPTQPAVSSAPVIEVRQPDLSQLINNPVTFDVRFSAAPGATIDLPTFRAKYGWLGIDITGRLLEHAAKTADGLSAENVDLPSGDHTITVSIADSAGRTGSRVLRLSVAK